VKRILGIQAALAAVVVRAAHAVLVQRVEPRRVNEISRIPGTECEGPKK
jgi:hypothetical protein